MAVLFRRLIAGAVAVIVVGCAGGRGDAAAQWRRLGCAVVLAWADTDIKAIAASCTPGSLHSMQSAMHIHPTVSEFIPTMMDDLKPLY